MPKPRTVHPVGARVYHAGQLYTAALDYGTAVITGHEWRGDHLEYQVRRDEPYVEGGSVDTTWAYYRTRLAWHQPAEIRVILDLIAAGRS